MRLNRFLATAGLGSRRASEALIREGRVAINGATVTELGTMVQPGDVVKVDGHVVRAEPPLTLLFHKPPGAVCSRDPQGAPRTVFDYLPPGIPRLFYIGRLDADSEGLLLLTNQGELAQRLAHPSHRMEKTYRVKLDKPLEEADARKMEKGFLIEPGFAQAESVRPLHGSWAEVVLTQGLNRQIRLMFWRLGYNVDRLIRTRIGNLLLGKLKPGQYEPLDEHEMDRFLLAPARDRRTPSAGRSGVQSPNRARLIRRPGSPGDKRRSPAPARGLTHAKPRSQRRNPRTS
ncbi:MAG: hypothetical protein OHK005_13610 [Candidatus Methylacidiphilales bacterium]